LAKILLAHKRTVCSIAEIIVQLGRILSSFKRVPTSALGGLLAVLLLVATTFSVSHSLVDVVSFPPLNELIELAHQQSRPQGGAGGVVGGAGKCAGATRRLLSQCRGSFSASRQKQSEMLAPTPNADIFSIQSVHAAGQRFVFAGCLRLEPPHRGVGEGAGTGVRFQMIAAYTTLTANVVVTAIQAAAVQAQIDATRQLVDLNSNMVEILRYQLTKGYASRLDVVAQESQLAQVTATLPPLLKQAAQLRDLLAVLAGDFRIRRRRKNSSWRVCNCRWKCR
jgi:hypothetical protein